MFTITQSKQRTENNDNYLSINELKTVITLLLNLTQIVTIKLNSISEYRKP